MMNFLEVKQTAPIERLKIQRINDGSGEVGEILNQERYSVIPPSEPVENIESDDNFEDDQNSDLSMDSLL